MSDKDFAASAATVEKKPRRRGCIGHCLRFWWAYLLVFIAVVVLVVCLVIFVGVPKIAQDKLDHAELTIQSIKVTNTKENSLQMSIDSTIRSDGKVHADIDPFVGDMYLEDLEPHTPFARINFPQTSSKAVQTVNVSQTLEITDENALTTFNTWLLANETLRVTVLGETKVKVKGISKKFDVTFKKTITMAGLRMFAGLSVFDTSVSIGPDERGNNFKGTVNIPNYSIYTIEIGNASFNTYLLGDVIGTTYIDNLILVPGLKNEYPMRATVDNGKVLSALGQKPFCEPGDKNGVLPLQLSGKEVVNKGENIAYFADALASANQTVEVDIGTPVAKLLGSPVECGGDH